MLCRAFIGSVCPLLPTKHHLVTSLQALWQLLGSGPGYLRMRGSIRRSRRKGYVYPPAALYLALLCSRLNVQDPTLQSFNCSRPLPNSLALACNGLAPACGDGEKWIQQGAVITGQGEDLTTRFLKMSV